MEIRTCEMLFGYALLPSDPWPDVFCVIVLSLCLKLGILSACLRLFLSPDSLIHSLSNRALKCQQHIFNFNYLQYRDDLKHSQDNAGLAFGQVLEWHRYAK